MRDLAFFEAGCHEPKGPRRAVVPIRRALRRLLRPMFQRQVELFRGLYEQVDRQEREARAMQTRIDELERRHDLLVQQMQATVALGWDYVATVRRLSALEDRSEAVLRRLDQPARGPDEARSIRFSIAAAEDADRRSETAAQARVS